MSGSGGQQAQQATEADITNQWEQLLELIEERVADSQISIRSDITDILQMLSPVKSQPVSRMLQLAQQSERMSDDEISSILSLDELHGSALPKSSISTAAGTRYYVRSIQLSVAELRRALQQYRKDYFDDDYCDSFTAQVQDMKPEDPVWLRYIGCTFASTPLDRHMDDIAGQQKSNRFSNFYSILESTVGRTLKTRVFEFTLLQAPDKQFRRSADRDLVDSTEQVLIHLFGRHVLLNSQPGGYYRSYVPNKDEQQCVSSLKLDKAKSFLLEESTEHPVDIAATIRRQLHNLHDQLLREDTPNAIDAAKMLDDEHIAFIARQATSGCTLQGKVDTLLMMFGTKITKGDHDLRRRFFDGSRSGAITADMIQDILSAQQLSNIPLYNMWPVPSRHQLNDDNDNAYFIETSANVMRILRSQIIVTLGYETAAVAQSKFRDR